MSRCGAGERDAGAIQLAEDRAPGRAQRCHHANGDELPGTRKVQHSLELLRKERESAEKILQVTQERQSEGFELPVEVTKAQLTRAQVTQRLLQLEGREDELEVFLRYQLGLGMRRRFR